MSASDYSECALYTFLRKVKKMITSTFTCTCITCIFPCKPVLFYLPTPIVLENQFAHSLHFLCFYTRTS